MYAMRVENLRSLEDTGVLKIKPITILLGQNSSGKSTFLRTFPLLRQSARSRSNAPVLWYGDYVDFGSFSEVVSGFSQNKSVKFHISTDISSSPYERSMERKIADNLGAIDFSIELREVKERTVLNKFSIAISQDLISIEVDADGVVEKVIVNGRDLTKLMSSQKVLVTNAEFVPQLLESVSNGNGGYSYYARYRRGGESVFKEINLFLTGMLDTRIGGNTITQIAKRISYAPRDKFIDSIRRMSFPQKTWSHFVDYISSENNYEKLDYLRSLYLVADLSFILLNLERTMNGFISGISYVGPSRVSVERYYRIQELAVDKIDPQGKNLAMFLHSLKHSDQEKFSQWLGEAIGYNVKVSKDSGHVRLLLKEVSSDRFYNIADMGYGFSQILPIMAQVWFFQSSMTRSQFSPTVVMEQPELHLHPAYQAKLADIFTRAIGSFSRLKPPYTEKFDMRFIIETHSEAFINRLGELISEGKFKAKDVSVYIFDKSPYEEKTKIVEAEFSDDGTLDNWPIGFFSANI